MTDLPQNPTLESDRLEPDRLEKGVEKDPAERPTTGIVSVAELLPERLPLIPVAHSSIFPGTVVPLVMPEGRLSRAVEHALEKAVPLGVIVTTKPEAGAVASGPSHASVDSEARIAEAVELRFLSEDVVPAADPSVDPYYRYGVAAKIVKKLNLPDDDISVLIVGQQRFRLKEISAEQPFVVGDVEYLYDQNTKGLNVEALQRAALAKFKEIAKEHPLITDDIKVAVLNIEGAGKLADFMGSILVRRPVDYQRLLRLIDVEERLRFVLELMRREEEVQTLQKRIQDEVNDKVSKAQREYYLNEQLKFIQRELGRSSEDRTNLQKKVRARLKGKKVPKLVRERIREELEKAASLHEQSAEYGVAFNYLDWLAALPWGVVTPENLDLAKAKDSLERHHYGIREAKDRVLEFLAVQKLKQKPEKTAKEGAILCLVGPPGTGKTSLGRSIAEALGRPFYRFSVGGMRDEAEIKGHRRTYVGALPGKPVQGLKRTASENPVFLIDEIDKMASGWASGGDPAAALLELLDPEQNAEFVDHYLDVPVDFSQTLFIATANSTDTIPPALLDRMELITLSGYTDLEKEKIARAHLLPRLFERNALPGSRFRISTPALRHVIRYYARESGVRSLEKQLNRLCRKSAFRIATGDTANIAVRTPGEVETLLGLPPFPEEKRLRATPGVANGLAWTQYGGDVLSVESVAVSGKGGLMLTGTLGKVMQESANIAYTFVRDRCEHLRLPRHYFDRNTLHLHVPAGATPKDGPSAGVTMVTSLYSLLTSKPVRSGVAMTGEITLTGRVLPVGGIKEKLLAAKRSRYSTVIVPQGNERDLKDLEPELLEGLDIVRVTSVDEALSRVF